MSVSKEKKMGKQSLELSDIINILGEDFGNIYSVNRERENIEIHRYKNKDAKIEEAVKNNLSYKEVVQKYISMQVLQEDKEKMQMAMSFENVCNQLKLVPQFTVHYRVQRAGKILYYYMKCARVGNADDFQDIIFAFANEDSDIRRTELEIMKKSQSMLGKRKILIVEDNKLSRDVLCSLLENKYELLTAENGEIGLKILGNHYKDLSLVLLDVEMPVCDGIEFLKRVKGDVLLSSVPIIVLTVNDESDTELTCLSLGASDFITKPYNADIVRGRINNVIRLKESALTLAVVEHDELTGLYTPQAFHHYAQTILRTKTDKKIHLILAKVRDFKLINNIYGKKKADEILCYLAAVYNNNLKGGILSRRSGASFVCLLYGDDELDHQKMATVVNDIAAKAPINGLKVKYGIYENIDKALSISTICDYASMAEETIIDNYDCDIAYYTEEIAQKRIYNQMIENNFDNALDNQEFVVYYQPKIDIMTENVVGAEALVRWKKLDGSIISPGDFIPVYESDGLIVKLDEYVFRQVCHFQKRIIEMGKNPIEISVNLSRSSILHGDMAEKYIEIMNENGLPFSCIAIELTESSALYSDRIKETMEKLVKAGFLLDIDDFGAGYSSLMCLNQLPFNTLKIDKSLIDHVCQDKGKTLVEQVIVLSKLLNMKVVAEGVETEEQLNEVKNMKCDEVQGFYYARPMREKEFIEYTRNRNQLNSVTE